MQQQEHSPGYGFGQAFFFPFRPGVLLYNCLGVLCMVLFVFSMNPVQQLAESREQAAMLSDLQQQELAIVLEDFRQSGADEADIEAFRQQAERQLQAFGQMANSGTQAQKLPTAAVAVIVLFIVVSYFITTKNFDITAQIADADFQSPSLKPNSYVSLLVVLKFFIGMLILGGFCLIVVTLAMILAVLLPFAPLMLLVFILYLFAMYPAIVLTIIRTDSLLGMLNPLEWHRTVKEYVSTLNYLFLLIFLLVFALLSVIVNAVLPLVVAGDISPLGFGAMLVVFSYLGLHISSSMHYMMGFMTQHETPGELKGDFSGYEKKHISEKNRHSLIGDIQLCLRNGHPQDADNLLKTLNVNEVSADEMTGAYELLINTYEQQGNHTAADDGRRRLLAYATVHAPQQRARFLPIMTTLVKSGEFHPEADDINTLATAAFNRQDYDGVLKIVGNFAKQYPKHADIVANYFVVGKVFHVQKQYEKAYRLLGGLIKKFPQHPLIPEIKSEFLVVKRKLPQS